MSLKRIGQVVGRIGGGMVDVLVDRDLDNYPAPGTPVYIEINEDAGRSSTMLRDPVPGAPVVLPGDKALPCSPMSRQAAHLLAIGGCVHLGRKP